MPTNNLEQLDILQFYLQSINQSITENILT